MTSAEFSEHVVGVQSLQRPLPILDLGVLQGRVWALHLEVPHEWSPGTPIELVPVGEQVRVALAVLRSAVRRALAVCGIEGKAWEPKPLAAMNEADFVQAHGADGHRMTSKAELLEWHATQQDYPDADMSVLGWWRGSVPSPDDECGMAHTDGERWWDATGHPCEPPDYWAAPEGPPCVA